MNPNLYRSLHNFIEARPGLMGLLQQLSRLLPGIIYLAYPGMLLYLLVTKPYGLIRGLLVPLAGFLICTVVRAKINAPRPYEKLGIPAITKKDTSGKSFPSRHSACGAVIAVTALGLVPPLGIPLLAVSLLICLTRVLCGVHFIRDVVCGWLLGAVIGWLGVFLI